MAKGEFRDLAYITEMRLGQDGTYLRVIYQVSGHSSSFDEVIREEA